MSCRPLRLGSTTKGGTNITIAGSNFGPPDGETDGNLVVTYGADGTGYNATNCVVKDQDEIECRTQPGVGKDLKWKVNIGNQPSEVLDSPTTRYGDPTVTGITAGPFNTIGNEAIVITGTNFGVGSEQPKDPTAFFGKGAGAYTDALVSCSVTEDHFKMSCTMAEGSGLDYQVQVEIAGQRSNASSIDTSFGYKDPTISNVYLASDSGKSALLMTTMGGDDIVLEGINFGPTTAVPDSEVLSVTYSNGLSNYTAASCRVHIPHSGITCKHVPGIGFGFKWTVVRSALTGQSTLETRYKSPNISTVTSGSGSGISGDSSIHIVINGSNFGPDASVVTSRYMSLGGLHMDLFNVSGCLGAGGAESWCTNRLSSVSPLAIFHGIYPNVPRVYELWKDFDMFDNAYAVRLSGKLIIEDAGTYRMLFEPSDKIKFSIKTATWLEKESNATLTLAEGVYSIVIEFLNEAVTPASDVGMSFNWTWMASTSFNSVRPVPSSNFARSLNSPEACETTIAHAQVVCKTQSRSTGMNFIWDISVGAQASALSDESITIDAPELLSVTTSSSLKTSGGEIVSFQGNNFGEDGLVIKGTYGREGISGLGNGTGFTFQGCIVVSKGIIHCTSANGAGTDHQTIFVVDGQSTSEAASVTFSYAAPSIAAAAATTPFVGLVDGGYTVVIHGSNFGLMNLASVRVGGSTVASFLDFTHESATFLMPLSESSTEEDVTIVVAGQSSGISPFYYYNLTSISPEFGSAAGGTNVAITGEGFVQMPTGSPGQVYFGSTDAAKMDVSVDGNEIKFVTVSHGAAVGTFLTPHVGMDRVTFNALNSPGSNFFFYPRPIVEDFAPKSGPTSGGTAVSIRADFFMTGTYEVTFGDSASIACTLSSEDDRVLICVAPSLPGGEAKQVDLNLTIDTADATSKTYVQAGTFQYYVPPAVVSIDPPLGPISASNETVVVITGSNFVATSDRPRIKVGSVERETFFDNVNGTIRFKTTVPRSLVEQTLAIEVALNGQQFTSSGVGFLFYDFPEEIVLLHQTLNFTLDDFSSTMDNKTIFVKAIAAALNVLKSQVNIIRIEINHNVGSRRLHNVRDTAIDTKKLPQWTSDDRRSLQETNTTLSIEYSVETRKANAQNISRNMSKIGASVGSPETTVLVSSLAESFEIPSESLSVNIAVHVVSVPEVDVSIPRIGPVRGGTALLISGKDFLNSTLITCKFDGLRISTSLSESDKAKLRCGTVEAIGKDTETCTKGTFLSHTQISCVTPIAPLATGKVFISVSMNNQQFNADRTFDFTYYDPAIATSLSEDFMPLSASTMVVSGSFFDTSVVQIQYTLDAEATLCKSCVKTSASPAASGILCEACPLSKHRCGDLVCSDEAGETCNTCPEDCGVCTTAVCGDFFVCC